MELIFNLLCFALGYLIGTLTKGEFTINYNHSYKDNTVPPMPEIKEPIGYKTNENKEDVDSPAEIAAKIQEALGVFIEDGEPEER